jgi:predicted sulfurtransferase
LETYGESCGGDESADSVAINENTTEACLYRGKNFVFDHRRTDPVIGNGITKPILTIDARNQGGENAEKTERISLVGRCIICSIPHDDYDNGHAPCEGKEARCCRCRVLILVCNICRAKVRCWGDPTGKQELYCGNSGNACVDDGNIAENVETALF